MRTISFTYLKEHLMELLQAVARVERVVIERNKRPVADLVPPSISQRRIPKFGTGKGMVKIIDPKWADPMTDEEVDALIGCADL